MFASGTRRTSQKDPRLHNMDSGILFADYTLLPVPACSSGPEERKLLQSVLIV